MINSLKFEQIEERYNNIRAAHTATCKWLLDHIKYLDWLDQDQVSDHHGILWIKGKAGSGKSTLMKVAFSETKHLGDGHIRIAFFFNARGSLMERDTRGLYRSLLFQLFTAVPEAEKVFDGFASLEIPSAPRYNWTVPQLTKILSKAIGLLKDRRLWIYVDALDECDEIQIRDMVEFFGELGEQVAESEGSIRILFSSRHYPKIFLKTGIELNLEDEDEHFRDVSRYVQSELRVLPNIQVKRVKEIREEIQRRASGIFIWVVFAVRMLNIAYDHGRIMGLEKKLSEIPDDLGQLFEGILNHDNQNLESMRLCLQWTLFAKRPLTRKELYAAIISGMNIGEGLLTSIHATDEIIDAFILSCSKGLVELTQESTPTVQFIHETVRDFLLKGDGKQYVHGSTVQYLEGLGHDALKKCCVRYISNNLHILLKIIGIANTNDVNEYRKVYADLNNRIRNSYRTFCSAWYRALEGVPFFEYALLYVLDHADAADFDNVPQNDFLESFKWMSWMLCRDVVWLINNYEPKWSAKELLSHLSVHETFLDALAKLNMKSLIRSAPKIDTHMNEGGNVYDSSILIALTSGNHEALTALLTPNRSQFGGEVVGRSFNGPTEPEVDSLLSAFYCYYDHKAPAIALLGFFFQWCFETDMIVLLRSDKFDLNATISATIPYSPLCFAAGRGYLELTRFLLEAEDADYDCQDAQGLTPLARAAQSGRTQIVSLLLRCGKIKDINAQSLTGRSSLSYAAENGHSDVVRLLLSQQYVDTNLRDNKGRTPLFYAAQCGHVLIVKLLLETSGIDIISSDNLNHTALSYAVLQGHEGVVRQLLRSGKVNINAQDKIHGRTALSFALQYGYVSIVKALLEYPGIDISLRDKRGRSLVDDLDRPEFEYLQCLLPRSEN